MKKRNKILFGILILIVIVSVLLIIPSKPKEDTIKIGTILQLTGTGSQYGEWAQQGIEIAKEEINKEDINGKKLEVIYEDSQSKVPVAISAFRKLREFQNIKFFITQNSDIALALAPISNEEKVIQIDIGATTPLYNIEDDFTFRTSLTSLQLAKEEARFVSGMGVKKVGYLYLNDEYGQGMKNVFKKEFERLGGEVIIEESFPLESTDIRTQLLKLKESDTKIIVVTTRLAKSAIIFNQAKEVDFGKQIITDVYGVEDENLFKTARNSVEGIIYVAPLLDMNQSSTSKKFSQRFKEKYGKEPTQMSSQSYDGLYAIVSAIKNCPNLDTECVKNNLYKIEFEGASGMVRFDSKGDVPDRPMIIKTIKNGEFVKYAA